MPPQFSVAPSGRCSYGVHPNSQIEVCVKFSGVVVGCNSFSTCDAQVTVRGFLDAEFHMKVVKSVMMKPSEFALLELLSICVVHRRLQRNELSSCRSSRKSEWWHPQLVRQCAHHSSFYLGLLMMSDGRSKCHE
jgi:hypothetical protein